MRTKILSNFAEIKSFTLNLNIGLKDYSITPIVINKGSLIIVDQTGNGLIGAVDAHFLSDFKIDSSKALIDSELNLAIQPIYRTEQNESFYFFEKKYSQPGIFNISINSGTVKSTKAVRIALDQSLEVVCESFAYREINCGGLFMTMVGEKTFFFSDSETNQTFTMPGNKTDYLGSSFSDSVLNYTGDKNLFLLTSSEFMLSFDIRGFDVFAIQAGDVTIQLLNFSFCEQNSCLDQFLTNSTISSLVVSQNWKLNLKNGFNRIYFSEMTRVGKGQVLLLIQNGTGKVGINENSLLPDFAIVESNGNYYLKRIGKFSYSRFCLNPIIDGFMYRYEIFKWKKYDVSGIKKIQIGVENFKSEIIEINLKDVNSIDIKCSNLNLDMSVNCFIFALSNDKDKNFYLLFDNELTKEFEISSIFYFVLRKN